MRKSVHRATARGASQARRRQPCALDEWGLYARSGQRKYLTAEERRRFIAAADAAAPEVRTLCLTLVYLGCRLSEALALTASNVEADSGLIAIRSLKKRGRLAIRQVPASPAFLALLVQVHGLARFSDQDADRRLWQWQRTRAWQLVKGVMSAARVYRLPASPRGLRHAYGVHAVLSGVPLPLVQKWLGHADISTTAIYTNVLGPEEREIAARMWRRSDFASGNAAASIPDKRASDAQSHH